MRREQTSLSILAVQDDLLQFLVVQFAASKKSLLSK